jgi:DNA-binding protein Fis
MKRQAILEMFSSKGYEPELLKMPMDMVSEDNVQKCVNELRDLEQQYAELQSKSVEEIWHAELVDLEKHLI